MRMHYYAFFSDEPLLTRPNKSTSGLIKLFKGLMITYMCMVFPLLVVFR